MTCAKVSARGSDFLRGLGRTSLCAGFTEGGWIAATTAGGSRSGAAAGPDDAVGIEVGGDASDECGNTGDDIGNTAEEVGGDAVAIAGTGERSEAIAAASGPGVSPHIKAAPSRPLPRATATSGDRARGAA
jgi:hypothetical protein